MVNNGVSRGCGTCKKRRKKCDETRPVCKACLRGQRYCLGYRTDADLLFRYYQSETAVVTQPESRTANGSSPDSSRHSERLEARLESMSDDEIDSRALESFVEDFCIQPRDPSQSRGYLSDLAENITNHRACSAVRSAALIVSLDSLGKRLNRRELRRRAQWLYQRELIAFQRRMANEATVHSSESLTITALFGLYEMISTTFPEESEHRVHALGITAIIRTFNSPMGLLADVTNGNTTSLLKRRLLTPPDASATALSLDDLALSSTRALWGYHEVFDAAGKPRASMNEVTNLFWQAVDSSRDLSNWAVGQDAWMQPQMVGTAGKREIKGQHGAVFWAGPVETFYDHWVAAVWAVWRKGMIVLASIAMQCAKVISDPTILERASRLRTECRPVVRGLLASMPFFLLKDVASVLQKGAALEPGPPVGGLMILPPLYLVLIQDNIISEGEAAYMRRCLVWMSEYQGLGQAKVLSGATDMRPKVSIEHAHTIIWVGMAL